MGMLTMSLLGNSGRGKAWLESTRLLLIQRITQIHECDIGMLFRMCTGTFCSAAASPFCRPCCWRQQPLGGIKTYFQQQEQPQALPSLCHRSPARRQ